MVEEQEGLDWRKLNNYLGDKVLQQYQALKETNCVSIGLDFSSTSVGIRKL